MRAEEHIGEKYNRLTVISVKRNGKKYYWTCLCDCGNTTVTTMDAVRTGHTKSCGCRQLETRYEFRHGEWKTPLFSKWQKMRNRCERPKDKFYKDYGGRGIKVCEEWGDFVVFSKWAKENGYKEGLSIERIDVNGDYEPSNCKWIPLKEQARNRRTTKWVEYNGKKMSLAEACELAGMKYSLVNGRMLKGWSFERAITEPKRVW